MKQDYQLDIDPGSVWLVNTPTAASKRLPFFVNEYGHYIAGPGYFTQRRGQNNYLLFYTLAGNGWLLYQNQEYILEKDQAAVIHCQHYHHYKTASREPWNFKWIHFNGTAAKEYYHILNESSLNVIRIKDSPLFNQTMDKLNRFFGTNDIPAAVNASADLTHIFAMLIAAKYSPANIKKYDEHQSEIQKTIQYIHANYSQKIALEDLTRIAYLSKYYFLRVFKTHTGVSPYEYLVNYRINKAKELLKNTALSIGEISDQVGFIDYNNFIRKFKQTTGITPLQYRKY